MKQTLKQTLGLILVVLLLPTMVLRAQTTTTGAIVGIVTDPQNAIVVGARITVRNVTTGIMREVTSNGQGGYQVVLLNPGVYSITAATGQGFKTLTLSHVSLTVGETLRANLHLKVGTNTEVVTVNGEAAVQEADSGALGTVIGETEIDELPLNGRDFLQLADLVPGAVVNNPKEGVVGTSFDGARSTYNAYQIDGSDSTDPEQNTLTTIPPLASIHEFRVETSTYSARYGTAGGAQVSVVTNSGGNQFHGTAYDYLRNKVLDALPWDFNGPRNTAPNYLFNQFGASVGGPIRKNKDFFFANAEYLREKTPSDRILTFAPNAAERSGDESQSLNPYTSTPVQLQNPYTGAYITSNVLPQSLISPVGVKLMSLWPMPNIPGADPWHNLSIYRSGISNFDKYVIRLDHTFGAADSIYGTFDKDTTNAVSTGDTPYGDIDNLNHGYTLTVHYIHTFGSHFSNDLNGSVTSFETGSDFALDNQNYGVLWGMDPTTNTIDGSPFIPVFGPGLAYFTLGGSSPPRHQNHSFNLQDNVILLMGNHSLQFGGDYERQYYNWVYYSGVAQPEFAYYDGVPGYYYAFGETGSPYADLLTAIPNINVYYGGNGTYTRFLRDRASAYLQDDWKATRGLVLNMGLRWDYAAPFEVPNGAIVNMDFNTGLPLFATGAPDVQLVTYPHETGGPNTPYDPEHLNFGPRIGFAYEINAKSETVLRGGYGLFYTAEDAATMEQNAWTNPYGGATVAYPKAFFWPDGQNHWNTLNDPPYGIAGLKYSSPGSGFYTAKHYPTGYIQDWNLTLDRNIAKMTAEVGYVASTGTQLNSLIPMAVYDYTAYEKSNAAIPGFFPYINAKGFSSNFNSLQASLQRTMARGLQLRAAYTYGHSLADASNDKAAEGVRFDPQISGLNYTKIYSNADFDLRHRFSISGEYKIPVGNHLNEEGRAVLGGWSTDFIYSIQTGFPFSVFDSLQNLPDQVCNGRLSHPTSARWFNYNCFPTHQSQTIVVDGVSTVVNVQGDAKTNIVYGPHYDDLDIGVHKVFNIHESVKLTFRAEAFNALNHTNLYSPANNFFTNDAGGAQIASANSLRDIQFALALSY